MSLSGFVSRKKKKSSFSFFVEPREKRLLGSLKPEKDTPTCFCHKPWALIICETRCLPLSISTITGFQAFTLICQQKKRKILALIICLNLIELNINEAAILLLNQIHQTYFKLFIHVTLWHQCHSSTKHEQFFFFLKGKDELS